MIGRRIAWAVLGLLVAATLVVGAAGAPEPRTNSERAEALAARVRCPTCKGLSAAESDAAAAVAVRDEIARRVAAGQEDEEVLAFLSSRYGDDILLTPPRSGVAGLVWVIPVAAVVAALAGMAFAFLRWRSLAHAPFERGGDGGSTDEPARGLTPDDEALVEAARRRP